jgi:hypothetical protein
MTNERRPLLETRLEERDGATWVTGLCPACWERFSFVAPTEEGRRAHVGCPNGHALVIDELKSEGAPSH